MFKKRYRWKGKLVTQATYENRIRARALKSKTVDVTAASADSELESSQKEDCVIKGRRIVDFAVLMKNLFCISCNCALSLNGTEKESRRGLASILYIRCPNCLLLNPVPTAAGNQTDFLFDVNKKLVLGALHSGLGCTHINKLLACLNIPCIDPHLFKRYERVVGKAAETVAKQSCKDATDLERSLTIDNMKKLTAMLPPELQSDFIISKSMTKNMTDGTKQDSDGEDFEESDDIDYGNDAAASTSQQSFQLTPRRRCVSESFAHNKENSSQNILCSSTPFKTPPSIATPSRKRRHTETNNAESQKSCDSFNESEQPTVVGFDDVVRLMVSYDMGWSKRGTGRDYDSLNGQGGFIGRFSGLVLDYGTRNRKCRRCDKGHPKEDHDCRLNFYGSAKAMESHLAASIAKDSPILKEKNCELGVLVGDNDSSTIAAVRNVLEHPVVKMSDVNHTSKGVASEIYSIEKSHKEMTREGIKYLHRCFCYAMAQNKGDTELMASAIRNIPHHAFNVHENCGDWCGFKKDPENYDHRSIPGGFHSQELYAALQKIFNQIASNCGKFSHGSSSQANESLNAIMASKAPKSRSYSESESADFRMACTVAQKNKGGRYLQEIFTVLQCSPGHHTSDHISKCDQSLQRRREKIKEPFFKNRRNILKRNRTMLRQRREGEEGVMYQSNMGLLQDGVANLPTSLPCSSEVSEVEPQSMSKIVFFDLETSNRTLNCDILQIGARSGTCSFSVYVRPRGPIAATASEVNGLTSHFGDLFLRGMQVPAIPVKEALIKFYDFLAKIGEPCVLVAHNALFDTPRFLRKLMLIDLVDKFRPIIIGFVDTLPIFKEHFKRKNNCSQTFLAQELLGQSGDGAHNAVQDVLVLQQLINKIEKTDDFLISRMSSFGAEIVKIGDVDRSSAVQQTLYPLKGVLSASMLKKLAHADITFDLLVDTFNEKQSDGVEELLKSKITKNAKVIDSILHFIESVML